MSSVMPTTKCTQCNKKGTQQRIINQESTICNECTDKNANPPPPINPDLMLSELSVRDFSTWFKQELKQEIDDVIQKKVEKATKKIEKDLEATKKTLTKATTDITELKTKVGSLTKTLAETKKERDELKTTGANNLKYLINLDRNVRRSNVILLGVPEDRDLVIGGNEAEGDEEKINALLNHIGVKDRVEIVSQFRLGKKRVLEEGEEEDDDVEEQKRPIKIILKNSEMASLITSNAKLLRPLDQKIFFKPDKSVKEREEFQRLLKKKNEKMIEHPTEEGAVSRVVLKQGILTVDGVEIDRYKTPQTIF